MHSFRRSRCAIWSHGLDAAVIAFAALLTIACVTSDSSPARTASQVTLERIGTIGCSACNDERQITPAVLAVLAGERVAILNPYEPLVRVFDLEGNPLLAFGTEGQGPGEIGQELPGVGYLPGMWLFGNELGGITVMDVFPSSLEVFDADGTFVTRRDSGVRTAVPVGQAFHAETHTYFNLGFTPGPNSPRSLSRCPFEGNVDVQCESFADPAEFLAPDGEPGDAVGALALAATPAGGLIVANTVTYELWVLGTDGTIIARSGRDLPLPLRSEAELEVERERFARMGRPDAEISPHRMHIESYGLQVDGSGRIWVLTGRHEEANSVLDVFSADGTYLSEVVIDAVVRRAEMRITPFAARGDLLVVAAQQPDGNDQVWVYRISPTTRE